MLGGLGGICLGWLFMGGSHCELIAVTDDREDCFHCP